MDDKTAMLFVIVLIATVLPLSLGLALWLVARLRRKSDQPLSEEAGGAVVVPVRGLTRTGSLFSRSKNSISPRLEIAWDGLRFKVFKPDHWPFADIQQVDAPWMAFATRIAFKADGGRSLLVDVADKAKARDLLRALPTYLSLTPRAVEMRDGVA